MITLTKETFAQAIQSETPILVKFGTEKGCKYCEQFAPQFLAFSESSDIPCYEYLKETLQAPSDEIFTKYNVQSFPTTIAFQKGKVINKKSGVISDEQLTDLTKTIYNISRYELEVLKKKVEIDISQQQLNLLQTQGYYSSVIEEYQKRLRDTNGEVIAPVLIPPTDEEYNGPHFKTAPKPPLGDFPLPPNTATTQPVEVCEGCQ